MSKKLFQILAVLMVFALLSGCVVPTPAAPAEQPAAEEPAAEEPAAEPESKGEIVFIPKSTSATFYLFLVKGAQDKAKELGYTIDYLGPATEADIAAQVDLVRNVTTKKPAGILLAALDSEALIPPVEEAMAAGVPVVMVDSGINSDVPVASIITDQYAGGFMAGEEMARLLGEEGLVADHGIQAGSVSAGSPGDSVDRRRLDEVHEHNQRRDHGPPRVGGRL
jgi:ribose transport system substrate-binding protein